MDTRTCRILLSSKKLDKSKQIHVFITICKSLASSQHDKVVFRDWLKCLEMVDINKISWDINTFKYVLLLASLRRELGIMQIFLARSDVIALINTFVNQLFTTMAEELMPYQYKGLEAISSLFSLSLVTQQSLITFALSIFQTQKYNLDDYLYWCTSISLLTLSSGLKILQNILEFNPSSSAIIASQGTKCLIDFIKTIYVQKSDESNNDFDQNTSYSVSIGNREGEGDNLAVQWLYTFTSDLVIFIGKCIMENEDICMAVSSIAECGLFLQSNVWQMQYLGMSLISAHLSASMHKSSKSNPSSSSLAEKSPVKAVKDNGNARLSSRSFSSVKSGTVKTPSTTDAAKSRVMQSVKAVNLLKNGSTKHTQDKKQSSSAAAIDLCRNGHIRLVAWCLLHSKVEIRTMALQVVLRCLELLSSPQEIILWSSLLEQGVTVLFEAISVGISIYPSEKHLQSTPTEYESDLSQRLIHNNYIFPERYIRLHVQRINHLVAYHLETLQLLRDRIYLALMHSRSVKLQGNILSGLLYLRGIIIQLDGTKSRCEEESNKSQIKKVEKLVLERNSSNSMASFRTMISEIIPQDDSSTGNITLLKLVTVLHYLLEKANYLRGKMNGVNTQTRTNVSKVKGASDGGNVIVMDESGVYSKMQYPLMQIIEFHSVNLQKTINELTAARLLLESPNAMINTGSSATVTYTSAHCLSGSYSAWQEIFSHMANDFILESSLPRLSLDLVMQMYFLVTAYDATLLSEKYAAELIKRLQPNNFVEIFRCASGYYCGMWNIPPYYEVFHPTSSQCSLNGYARKKTPASLIFLSKCMAFLCKRVDEIVRVIQQDSSKKSILIELLCLVFNMCMAHTI